MGSETDRERARRAVDTVATLKRKLERSDYTAPECMGGFLWELYLLLADHFGRSSAYANVPHVGAILRDVAKRREEDATFAAALDDYLGSEPSNEPALVAVAGPEDDDA